MHGVLVRVDEREEREVLHDVEVRERGVRARGALLGLLLARGLVQASSTVGRLRSVALAVYHSSPTNPNPRDVP